MTDTPQQRTAPGSDGSIEMIGAPPIAGLTFRHFRGGPDLGGIVEVIHVAHRLDGVDAFPSVDAFRNELANPVNEDPARDLIVAEVDGEIVAYGRASWSIRGGAYVYQTSGEVHPDHRRRGIGRSLLHTEQARLRAIAAGHPTDVPRTLQAWIAASQVGAAALLRSDGYETIRWFSEMARTLGEPIPIIAVPDGLEIRPVVPADHQRIFKAEAEAFQDHWGNREWTDTDRARFFGDPDLDTSLWRVGWDGDEVAGVVVVVVPRQENIELGTNRAWLDRISVRRPWRRRGLARALIASALDGLRERGIDAAMLGVDTENPTGALALYEDLGFHRVDHGEVLVRPLGDGPSLAR